MKPAITTLQKIAKAGKILSRIVFVLSIIAACSLVFALVFYIVIGDRILIIGGISIDSLILQETGMRVPRTILIAILIIALVGCLVEVYLSQTAVTYFKHELADGTPFTFHGAKELKRLGILALVLPLAVSILGGIALSIVIAKTVPGFDTNDLRFGLEYSSVGTGIFLLVGSVFCRHGAENQYGQMDRQNPLNQQWTPQMGYSNPQWNMDQQGQYGQQNYGNQQSQGQQPWTGRPDQQWDPNYQDPTGRQ